MIWITLCKPTVLWEAILDATSKENFTSCEAPGHAASSGLLNNLLRSHCSVPLEVSATGSCCRRDHLVMELFCTFYSGVNLNPSWEEKRETEEGGRRVGRERQEGKGRAGRGGAGKGREKKKGKGEKERRE